MAFNEDHFQDLREFNELLDIGSAKEGKKLTATKEGTVKGNIAVDGSGLTLSLRNMLFLINRKFHLLSLTRLLKAGVKVNFKPDRAILSKNGETITVAKLRGSYLKMSLGRPVQRWLQKEMKVGSYDKNVSDTGASRMFNDRNRTRWLMGLAKADFVKDPVPVQQESSNSNKVVGAYLWVW